MNGDLQVGDLVMLSPDTVMNIHEAWNPLNEVGEVVRITHTSYGIFSSGVYVSWPSFSSPGGIFYASRGSDLILQYPHLFKTREEARKVAKEKGMVVTKTKNNPDFKWSITIKEI